MAKEAKAKKKLLEMLKYMRPDGGLYQDIFCVRFIEPLMGTADPDRNYVLIIPDPKSESKYPRIAFMAHHDTVHKRDGLQSLEVYKAKVNGRLFECVSAVNSNCLGADCTTGVWLILEMIKAHIPGIYIIHAGEECGGIGSSALVASKPDWLSHIDVALSFDRKGYESIITEQWMGVTASKDFARDLESILNLNLKPDPTGSYTDSAEYMYDVSECTNLSVGYFNQHTHHEYQDLDFAMLLRERLIKADWSKLNAYRDASAAFDIYSSRKPYVSRFDYDDDNIGWNYGAADYMQDYSKPRGQLRVVPKPTIKSLVEQFPDEIADLIEGFGYTAQSLEEELIAYYYKG